MLNKFKNWLGIEGLKIELLIPESIGKESGFVDGRIVFNSKQMQVISGIHIQIFEKYTRGRGTDIKVDEFEIGSISFDQELEIKAFQETHLDFALPFTIGQSSMDEFGDKNILSKGIAKAAKAIHQVKSEYKVIATAQVKGTALDPFDEKWIQIQ